MRLVPDEHPIEGAGLCFICEAFINRDKVEIVDTNRDFDPAFHHPLTGRKYVCGECAHTIGYTVGMVRTKDVEAAHSALEDSRTRLLGLQQQIASLSLAIEDQVHDVVSLPVLDVPKAVTDKQEVRDSGA